MIKNLLYALFLMSVSLNAQSQKDEIPTLKSILLEQLKTTHDQKDWFVPLNIALEGLTPDQANWTDGKGNHSVAQLATHLIFWNERSLKRFNNASVPDFTGMNDETFTAVTKETWPAIIAKADSVLKAWEKVVETSDDAKLQKWYSTIAHIGAHNAYHIGQIIYIRKQQGSWDANKGVK